MTAGQDRIKYVFIWPAVLVVLLVTLFPLVYSLAISFQSVRLVPADTGTLRRLRELCPPVAQPRFWDVFGNTATIVFVSVGIQYVLGFMLALALHYKVKGEQLFRISFLMPMLMAPVAVALIWKMLLHSTLGPVNHMFTMIGLPNLPFLTDSTWAMGSIIIVEVWQWTPFVMLLLLAGLQSLPDDIYEAARLEDASPWTQFWSITFPLLLPISVAVVFIRIIEAFKVIDTVFVLTGGGPGTATETLTLYAYQEGLKKFNLGYTAALSFAFLVIVIIFGLLYLAILKPQVEKRL